jgi:hypothetical protein
VRDGERGVAVCGGPCGRPTPHEAVRPVDRRLQPMICLVCGTVRSIPKHQLKEKQGSP